VLVVMNSNFQLMTIILNVSASIGSSCVSLPRSFGAIRDDNGKGLLSRVGALRWGCDEVILSLTVNILFPFFSPSRLFCFSLHSTKQEDMRDISREKKSLTSSQSVLYCSLLRLIYTSVFFKTEELDL
jgi:hypothetical protein